MNPFVLLVIWTGFVNSQTLAVVKFDNMEECQAAKRAIVAEYSSLPERHIKCVWVEP